MKLIVLGDLHYPTLDRDDTEGCQIRDTLYTNFFRHLSAEKPDAYICCGDLTNSGDLSDLHSLVQMSKVLPAPIHYVLGNHDTHGCSKAAFGKVIGRPPYYSVTTPQVKLIFLDTTLESCVEDWVGVLDATQYNWFMGEVQNSDNLPVVVVAHHPVGNTTRRSDEHRLRLDTDIWPILSQKPYGIYMNGHNHYHSIVQREHWLFLQTGDFLSHLDYRVVEYDGQKLTVATHSLGGDLEGTALLAQKMKRYTLYSNLCYDRCDLAWEGNLSKLV